MIAHKAAAQFEMEPSPSKVAKATTPPAAKGAVNGSMAQRLAQRRLERSSSRSCTPRGREGALPSHGSPPTAASGARGHQVTSPASAVTLPTRDSHPPPNVEEQLGHVSARAFISAGLQQSSALLVSEEAQIGQMSARSFIGLGIEKAAAASNDRERDVASAQEDEVALLTARLAIDAGISGAEQDLLARTAPR
ncbi:hypothetical protein AB1Y20_005827 [Prymnesium parvum]|uniref:Uncharacterized protein n=1 Tax=Prymnesium parvum TaxID=97485 RepID=A0AB34J0V9_PRYPA